MTDRESLQKFIAALKSKIGQQFGGTMSGVQISPMHQKAAVVTVTRTYVNKGIAFRNVVTIKAMTPIKDSVAFWAERKSPLRLDGRKAKVMSTQVDWVIGEVIKWLRV